MLWLMLVEIYFDNYSIKRLSSRSVTGWSFVSNSTISLNYELKNLHCIFYFGTKNSFYVNACNSFRATASPIVPTIATLRRAKCHGGYTIAAKTVSGVIASVQAGAIPLQWIL